MVLRWFRRLQPKLLTRGEKRMFTITADMVKPIGTAVAGAAPELVTVGVGIMAILIGVSMIPRIIYKFF